MSTHPDDLFLLRWLDGEAASSGPAADHVTGCVGCQERLAVLAAEAGGWRAALALTVDEVTRLRQYDLPGRLIAAVAADADVARISAGVRQLAGLLGFTLAVAVAWALVMPWLEPFLLWAGYLIDVPTLSLLLVAQVAVAVAGALAAIVTEPGGLLLGEAVLLAAALALLDSVRRRSRALSPVSG